MILDAIVYVSIAVLTALNTQIGTDEAAKYIDPVTLFWVKIVAGCSTAGFLALKMFRSETFSKWKQERNGNAKHEKSSTSPAGLAG